jgi:hypothetical protein
VRFGNQTLGIPLLDVVGSRLAGPAVAAMVRVVDALPPDDPDLEPAHALSARAVAATVVIAMVRTSRPRGSDALELMTVPFFS